MKMAIDGTPAIHDVSAIRRYAHHLLSALAGAEEDIEYTFLFLSCKPWHTEIPFKAGAHIRIRKSFLPGLLLRNAWRILGRPNTDTWLPKDCRWLHFPGGYPYIPNTNKSLITTLHGFAAQYIPEHLPPAAVLRARQILAAAVKRCHHFITVSDRMKAELMALYKIPADRITPIPLGVSPEFREYPLTDAQAEAVRRRYHLPKKKYILFVGTLAPHKNIDHIIAAYQRLGNGEQAEYQLVLAGKQGPQTRAYRRRIEEAALADHVSFIDYIQPGSLDLAYLYNMADICLFPSYYEGWASPPLEAMLCGTPVIAADIPGLRESTGGTALYCQPNEQDSSVEQIQSLMHKPELYAAQKAAGLRFASQFTWARCAQRTAALYRDLAG